jgi:KDO2-lipid IV(A) lauroyltransferase
MRLLVLWVSLWPERWALGFGEGLGHLAHALGLRRRVVLENLAQVFPEQTPEQRQALARAHYGHLGRAAMEFFRAGSWTDADWDARIDPFEWSVWQRAHAEGNGSIVAVAHLGNFELLAAYGAHRREPLTVVTRQLRGTFNRAWLALRGELGVRELRGRNVIAQMLGVLRERGVLAVVIDQNMLPKRALFVPLFGRQAATTPAPAVLAERTGAPVVLAALARLPDGRFRVRVLGPFRSHGAGAEAQQALMAELNAALEGLIRAYPEQWFWVHRRWKTRPPGEHKP